MAQPSPPSLSYNNRKWFQITGCQQVFIADLVWPKDTLDASETFSLEDIKFPGGFPGHLPAFTSVQQDRQHIALENLILVRTFSLVDFHTGLRVPKAWFSLDILTDTSFPLSPSVQTLLPR